LLDDNSGDSLYDILQNIDKEKIFEKIFKERLKSNYFQIENSINTQIYTLQNDKEDIQATLKELNELLIKLFQKKSRQ